MDFAKSLLEKQGWQAGQGLGKDEDGIKEAIKVKVKQDKAGVGVNPGEEFTFHWWDHIFNKAASNMDVSNSKNGVQVKQTCEFAISNKKPLKGRNSDKKQMLYGKFVKAATLSNGLETPQASDSEESSDDDSNIHTTISQMIDEELLRICGGRTAHKGARHGIKMNGKLARIEEQELSHVSQSDSCSSSPASKEKSNDANDILPNSISETPTRKPKKKKKNKEVTLEKAVNIDSHEDLMVKKDKKRKKRKRDKDNEGIIKDNEYVSHEQQCTDEMEYSPTGNKKRKRNQNEMKEFAEVDESVTEVHMESSLVKKKKKKKSKRENEENEAATPDTLNCDSTDTATVPQKNKKTKKRKERNTS